MIVKVLDKVTAVTINFVSLIGKTLLESALTLSKPAAAKTQFLSVYVLI